MLQGAIIGMIVGLIMVAVRFVKQKKGAVAVLAALKEGGPDARQALDQWQPPIAGKIPAAKLINYLERLSWMAVIGDLQSLEQEGSTVQGSLTVMTQLQAQALAGLIAHRDNPTDREGLERVTARIHNEGGAMLGLVKKTTTDLNAMSRAIAGQGLDAQSKQRLLGRARQSGPAQKVVLLRLIAKATTAAGEDGTPLLNEAQAVLAKFG